MFSKILIANRGEIACRVAATCARMAIRTVAVYSTADAQAKHVAACDEAIFIGLEGSDSGGNAPKDSYLRWQAIIAAAKRNKVDLIVMASHGRKGIKRLLLGSETQQVLTHSHIPVLVLR